MAELTADAERVVAPVDAAAPAAASELTPSNLKIAFACFIGAMMVGHTGFAAAAISVTMIPLSHEFGWGRGLIGGAITAMTWAGALATPFTGRYVDKFGARGFLIGMAVLISLATMAIAFSTSWAPQFYACFILLGLTSASYVAYTKIFASLFARHRGKALAFFSVEVALVSAAMPPIIKLLLADFGWRGVFVCIGVAKLVISLPILIAFLKDPTYEARRAAATAGTAAPAVEGMTAAEALRSWPFWLQAAANIGGGMTIFGLMPHLVGIMTSRGLTVDAAIGAMSLMALFLLIGQFSSALVMDKVRSPKLAAVYVAVFFVGVISLSRASAATGPAPLYAGIALMGLGGGGLPAVQLYQFTRYFGLKALAEILGLSRALMALITGVSPLLMGIVFDRTSSYDIALAILIGASLSSVVFLLLLPPYRYAAAPLPSKT